MDAHPPFTFAYQPIVDVELGRTVSQEALVRGPNGESAYSILSSIDRSDLYAFDEQLRIGALRLAHQLADGDDVQVNLNLMPRALELSSDALTSTLETAASLGIPLDAITIEITESEIIHNISQFVAVANEYRSTGIRYAIDDFGAGYAGLNLLAEFQPDAIKLDRELVRGIEGHGPRQAIVRGLERTCEDLGIEVIAEGVETEQEFWWFRSEGIELFQGYLLAKPEFQGFPDINLPTPASLSTH